MAEKTPLLVAEGDADAKDLEVKDEEDKKMAAFAGFLMAAMDANDFGLLTFLPSYFIDNRHLTKEKFGMAFSWLSFGILVLGPFVPILIPRLGGPAKTAFYGLCLFTFSRLLFCFLVFVPVDENTLYFHLISANFGLTGFAYALAEIGMAAYVLLYSSSRNRQKALAALVEGRSVGALAGPAFAGVVYGLGSRALDPETAFIVPFLLGVLMMLGMLAMGAKPLLGAIYDPKQAEGSMGFKSGFILSRLPIFLAFTLMAIGFASQLFFFPLLQPLFADKYDFGSWKFGLSMTFSSLFFIIGAHFTPTLSEKLGSLGALFAPVLPGAALCLLYGPSPLLASVLPAPSASSVWLPLAAMVFGSILEAPSMIITPDIIMQWSEQAGFTKDDAASQVGMLQVVIAGISMCVGPLMGGVMAERYGYALCMTYGAFGFASITCLCLLAMKGVEPKAEEVAPLLA